MLSAYLCLEQFMTTIHVINTFVRLIVSARYICIAFHSFPLHSVFFIKKDFFLSFRVIAYILLMTHHA